MRRVRDFACSALLFALAAPAQAATSVLFVGNSFTLGDSPRPNGPSVGGYKPSSVTDLNGRSFGGVPALFKEFTVQAGLDYSVSFEAVAGYTIGNHYDNRLGVIDRAWDVVVLQSHSVLDPQDPGNPARLIADTGRLSTLFNSRNADVDIYLTATWSRADLTYSTPSPWFGQPIDAMANDIWAGYAQAAAASADVTGVIEVGGAWNNAMLAGLADPDPYDGLTAGQISLWGTDRYHASFYGSYLMALMQFGAVTGVDPRVLGANETAAAYLGLTPVRTLQLQAIAHATLASAAPEPAAWAMLLFGFGVIGGALRYRRAAKEQWFASIP